MAAGDPLRPNAPPIPPCPGAMQTDLSRWPIVVMTAPSMPMTDADFKAFLSWMEKHITCGGRHYVLVNDSRYAPAPTAQQRKLVADQMERLRPFTQKHCLGSAMVFESALMRGIMTAILWMSKPDYPTKVFRTLDEALAWAEIQLGTSAHRFSAR